MSWLTDYIIEPLQATPVRRDCIRAARHNRWAAQRDSATLPPPASLVLRVVEGAPPTWYAADSHLLSDEDPGKEPQS